MLLIIVKDNATDLMTNLDNVANPMIISTAYQFVTRWKFVIHQVMT